MPDCPVIHGAFLLPPRPAPAKRLCRVDVFRTDVIAVTAYTQTTADIEAGIGDRAKAGQVLGNFNTLLMLRVRNEQTARVLTEHLPRVRVFTKTAESRVTDNYDPDTPVDFTSTNADRVVESNTELLMPADLMALPKGQCFALLHGGHLYKLRLPLPG